MNRELKSYGSNPKGYLPQQKRLAEIEKNQTLMTAAKNLVNQ